MKQEETAHNDDLAEGAHYVSTMAKSAFQLARATHWPGQMIPKKEQAILIIKIRTFLLNRPNPFNAYIEFCERLMLTNYAASDKRHYQNIMEWRGWSVEGLFEMTALCYEAIKLTRKKTALYKHEWKILAEAILDLNEIFSCSSYTYWKGLLFEKGATIETGLLRYCVDEFHIKY